MSDRRPNFLIIMADQLAGAALPFHGHTIVHAPNITALAEGGVDFASAYCNSPLCAPSRASMLAGRLPSRIGAYDNAAPFGADVPTLAHYLRALGYRSCLAGKMHFAGPDQLHGFEERLTTDIYPSDFGWTPDWERPGHRCSWYHNMLSVVQAGVCTSSNQLDFDESVAYHAVRKLYDLARDTDQRPFCLVASFTHPHDPFAIPQAYWDRYEHAAIDAPAVAAIPQDQLDPHSRRLRAMCAMDEYALTEQRIRNARHAYYGAISYVDDKVGQLLAALEATGQRENTIVLFCSDHGEMLGERGLWYKMSFWEWSARVPLIIHAPWLFAPRRVDRHVSLVDLLPTLLELAGGAIADLASDIDGHSLVPLMRGDAGAWPDTVLAEYLAEGTPAPCLMIRRQRYKYIWSAGDPDQLYDLDADPHELDNLAGRAEYEPIRSAFEATVFAYWDPHTLRRTVIDSQRRRRLVAHALAQGQTWPWDFQPHVDAARQYIRNTMDLDDLERRARFPAPPLPELDGPAAKL